MSERTDRIEKRGEQYVLLTEEGEELEGPFSSEEEAAERLREIEAAKAARSKDHEDAVWSAAFVNDLPDSSFLFIESGGSKDDEGKTTPRSLRHFPVKGPDGAVDLPHLRNALARIPQADIPAAAKSKATAKARAMLEKDRADSVRRFDYVGELHVDPERSDGILMRETPEGFLRADARPARTGVQIYRDADGNRWGEYRDPSEVFDEASLRSYDLAVVTNDHPSEFVSLDNRSKVDVGAAGTDARPDGRFVRVSLVVRDKDAIQDIKDGKSQLSCGYTAQVIADDGIAEGLPFAARQTKIRINHIAIVSKGRAGPECSILARGDAFHLLTDEVEVSTKTIKIGDDEFEVPEAVADAYEALASKSDDGAETDVAALRAKVDMLEARAESDAKSFADRVDARSKLIATAAKLEVKTDGETDEAIMKAVVLAAIPSMKDKIDAHGGDKGYLRACYDQALDMMARRDQAVHDANHTIFAAVTDGGGDVFEEVLTSWVNRGKPEA